MHGFGKGLQVQFMMMGRVQRRYALLGMHKIFHDYAARPMTEWTEWSYIV